MSTGGDGRSALRRTGKLLILRLTPRLLRRWRRGGTRSCRISSRTALCSAGLSRGGNGAEDEQFAADDSDRVQERQPVGILVGPQRRFMHEAANGEMRHHQAEEFLPDSSGVLLRNTILAPRTGVFSSSRAVSISQRS